MARILVIDDSPTDRAVFSHWLKRAGHEVIEAESAEEGLAIARSHLPDMVLMDVVLPGMSGFQATRALTRDESTKFIPVLIISTKGMEIDRNWGIRQGAVDYIVKPPTEEDFIARVNKLVS